jgi:protein O-GlcNAc transferase
VPNTGDAKPQAQNASVVALQARFKQGVALHQQGNLAEAERIYEEVLRKQPDHFDALHLLGIIALHTGRAERGIELIKRAIGLNANIAAAHSNLGNGLRGLKRPADALASYDRAIALKPDFGEAYYNRGNALLDLKRPEDALASYDRAIALRPDYTEAYNNRGNALLDLKRVADALASYDKAIALKPNYTEAFFNRGNALKDLKRLADALASYDKAIALRPDYTEAYYSRGVVLQDLKRPAEALASYDKVIALKPDFADAYSNRGNALLDLKRHEEALVSCDKAIALKPDFAEAHYNRGNALKDLKRPADALGSYDRAIAFGSDFAEAYYNRGNALLDLKRSADALASYDRAIALKPDFTEAYSNRGAALIDLKRPEDALVSCDKAIALKSDHADAYGNRGNALLDLKRFADALASYDKAIALKPDFAEVYSNRGNALQDLNRPADALACYDKAIVLKPDLAGLEGLRLHTKMHLCDWRNIDNEWEHLISAVRNGKVNAEPFAFLSIPSTSSDQLKCAKLWNGDKYLTSKTPIWQGERYDHKRIRVAYVSADFRSHPGAYSIAGLIEQHDRSRFEIIGVSFGVDDRSEIRKRVVAAFDEFYDVRGKSDDQVAKLLHDLQIDIAIDRNGYTKDSRSGIFAHRPAPIQINYLGFVATMGTAFIDYIIADKVVAPLEHRQFYTEKIVQLPDCYQANDTKRKFAERPPTRQEVGLPQGAFVFCCFNNNYKITPAIFDIWMRILKQVEGGVFWILEDNATAAGNLRKEAEARGVNADRLIFAKRMSVADHLARHRLADLFLDTLPYNAHSTASDALWAGLPVLTCLGETFAGRVAASLLNAIHLSELITTTLEDYERLAIEIATNPEKLARIKRKLADNRLKTPLFDTKLFTKHIEAAYTAMYERHKAGLAPDHIIVPN